MSTIGLGRRRVARGMGLGVATVVLCLSSWLTAAPTPAARARATALFKEGRSLLAQKDYPAACAKLEESQRLDAGVGTLLNLATCHEHLGKTASAWAEFSEAFELAKREKRKPHMALAKKHIDKLEPTLSKLVIEVPPEVAETPDLAILRNGVPVARSVWGWAFPVDPGPSRIEVSAPGMKPWSNEVQVGGEGDQQTVQIPPLVKADPVAPEPVPAKAKPAAKKPAPAQETSSVLPTAGWVAMAVGVTSMGVGTYFGIRAMGQQSDSEAGCPPDACHDEEAAALTRDAATSADMATVFFAAGGAVAALGVVLVVVSPSDDAGPADIALDIAPQFSPYSAGLVLNARW